MRQSDELWTEHLFVSFFHKNFIITQSLDKVTLSYQNCLHCRHKETKKKKRKKLNKNGTYNGRVVIFFFECTSFYTPCTYSSWLWITSRHIYCQRVTQCICSIFSIIAKPRVLVIKLQELNRTPHQIYLLDKILIYKKKKICYRIWQNQVKMV